MALSEFDRKYLTDAQQAAVIKATADWNAAKKKGEQAGMDAAAKRAAAVRAQAGYSGGKDGTGYTALGNGGKPKVVKDLSPLAVERADERDKSNAASATRQAAQTAPNTPVAKGSFTGNRETMYTPKFSAGKLVAGTVEKGLNEFSQGIGATGAALEKVLLSPLDLVTGEKFGTAASEIGLFSKARENDRQTGERLQQKYASNVEAGGKAAQLVDKYGTMTVAAIPDALLAVATGGGSAAPTVGKAAQSAAYKIAESYAKNPQFWAAFARVFGTGYEQAKADGASEADAYAYALGNGMFNAAIEVGGGIQTLPRELQNESVWRAVGKTMVEEAGEEVTQGIAERGAQNIFYNKGNPLFSATDPNAVLNPNTAKEEAIGGAVVGGLLGGGQAGTVNLINAIVNAQNTAPQTQNTDTAQIPSQIPRSAENGGNLADESKAAPQGEKTAQSAQEKPSIISFLQVENGKRVPISMLDGRVDANSVTEAFESGRVGMDAKGNAFLADESRHIDRRNYGNVSDRSVNAFQFDNPWLHGYFVEAANALYDDFQNAEKGGQIMEIPPAFDEPGLNSTYIRTKRSATPEVEELLDDARLSYGEIDKAITAIIENHGQENYAAAKKVEVLLDKMLTNGYTTSYGEKVPPNARYIADKASMLGSLNEGQETVVDELADVDALPAEKRDGLGGADAGTLNSSFQNMQAQSDEFHPINENAAQREVETLGRAPEEVPTVNPTTGQNIQKTVSTILNSEITSNDMVPILEQAVSGGKFDYMPVTDEGAMREAQRMMQSLGGWQSAATSFIAKANFGKTTKNDFALGVACYNEAVSAGDNVTAFQLADAIGEVAHTSAQTVQAVNLFNRLTPAGKLLTLKNHLRRVNAKNAQSAKPKKAAATAEYADNLDALESGRPDLALTIDEDLATAYLLAETDEARAAAWRDIIVDIASKMPPTAAEKWNYWRHTSMLTNPVTHVRNTVGNTVQDGLRRVKNAVGVVMERVAVKDKAQRTKAFLTNSESDKALKDYARELYEQDRNAAMGVGKYSETGASGVAREIQNARKMFGEKFAIGKAVQKIGDVNTAALEAEDLIFNRGAYVDSLAQALKAKGITYEMAVDGKHDAAVEAARAYAVSEAAKATYRDSNAFSDFVSNLGKTGYKPADALVDALLPFRRTPANILVRGTVDYSPLALVKAFAQVKSGADVSDVVDTLSSGLTGTGVLALGAYLAAEGLLHIKAGGDDREEDFLKASGYQDFALRLGDTSYTLDWLVPAAMPLFAGVALWNGWEENGGGFDDFLSAMGGISDVILETSMLQSINSMIENMSYADNKAWFILSSALTSYLSQAVPTIGGKIASAMDDTARKAYTQGGKSDAETDASYFVQSILRKVPGGREQLQPSIDLWGREISNGGAAERFFEAFVSPGFFSTADTGAVTKELQRLAATQGSTVYPVKASRSFTVNGKTKYLTAEEYTEFAKDLGQTRYGILDKLLSDKRYKALSDADKADVIADVYEFANAKAKSDISEYTPTSWVQKAMDSGNAADYIISRWLDLDAEAKAKEEKAAAWEKTLESLKPYGVTQEVLDDADLNGGGVNQAEMAAYLKTRGDLDAAAKQMIWNSVGGWKTSYADYVKKHK